MSTGTSPESNDKSINTLKNLKGPQEYNQKTEKCMQVIYK